MAEQCFRFVYGITRVDSRHHLLDEVDGVKKIAGLLVVGAQLSRDSGDLLAVAVFEASGDPPMKKLGSGRRHSTRQDLPIQSVSELIMTAAGAVRPFDVLTTLQKKRAARQSLAFLLDLGTTAFGRRRDLLGGKRNAGNARGFQHFLCRR